MYIYLIFFYSVESVELSIVFTTPETVDRKHTTNRSNAKNTNNGGGKRKTDVHKSKHDLTSTSSNISKRNSNATAMNSDSTNHNNFSDDGHGNVEANSHNYVFSNGRNNSKGSINNGTLYSRVVAPPASRSSSSSSSSESTTSYDSSGMFTPSNLLSVVFNFKNGYAIAMQGDYIIFVIGFI